MIAWRLLPDEEWVLYSPIGLRLLDDFTGGPVLGRVRGDLQIQDGASWRPTTIRPITTPSGVLAYPGLGRSFEVA